MTSLFLALFFSAAANSGVSAATAAAVRMGHLASAGPFSHAHCWEEEDDDDAAAAFEAVLADTVELLLLLPPAAATMATPPAC